MGLYPAYHMKKEPIDDPCIPIKYKDAHEKLSFHLLCQNAFSILHVVATKCGGKLSI